MTMNSDTLEENPFIGLSEHELGELFDRVTSQLTEVDFQLRFTPAGTPNHEAALHEYNLLMERAITILDIL